MVTPLQGDTWVLARVYRWAPDAVRALTLRDRGVYVRLALATLRKEKERP